MSFASVLFDFRNNFFLHIRRHPLLSSSTSTTNADVLNPRQCYKATSAVLIVVFWLSTIIKIYCVPSTEWHRHTWHRQRTSHSVIHSLTPSSGDQQNQPAGDVDVCFLLLDMYVLLVCALPIIRNLTGGWQITIVKPMMFIIDHAYSPLFIRHTRMCAHKWEIRILMYFTAIHIHP